MKTKLILPAIVVMFVAGWLLCCAAEELPTQQAQQAEQATAQVGAPAKKKAMLVKLDVPAAESFKTEDGRKGWKLKIPGGRPLATPAVVHGILFVGGGFGSYEFYALDAGTGKPKWTFQCGDDGPTAAVAAEGCVAYNTESCIIYVHELTTGKVLWHKWLGDPLMSQPAIAGGRVLMAYPGEGGHHLACFGLKTGKKLWDNPIAAEVISAPVVAGDFVVLATVDGTLYRFDLATGKPAWKKECKTTSAPRVLGGQVFISQRSEKTIELKDKDGKKKSSKITVEGLNVVSLEDGAIAHAEPLAAVKASFLLGLEGQRDLLSGGQDFFILGQDTYTNTLDGCAAELNKVKGNPVPEAAALIERINKLKARKISEKPAEAEKNAKEALELAKAIEKVVSRKPDSEKEKEAFEKLRKLAAQLRETAGKTLEAAEAAKQAEITIAATEKEAIKHKDLDASVGFAVPPAAAQLDKATANIGQAHVKSVWAFQGSRPCLFDGMSIMVHGPRMRAVENKTGEVKWEHRFDFKDEATRPVTPPALAGGKLYVGTVDGRIVCIDARSGKRLWQSKVGGRILFEPAVVGGCVYAASDDGTLICLETGDKSADGWHMWGAAAGHNGQE